MPAITPQQSTFFAHKITLEGLGDEALAQSLSTARVDMNPHQVDAALFALSSPLSKGVILADEVGLGKTIEAGLVIAQRWAERKRRILLIVPASLRKQWSQELQEKFSLPSVILESKSYNAAKKGGLARPFEQSDKVVITSYEFGAAKDQDIVAGRWDLVVFDEAHRLRNVYKKGASVRAKALRDATRSFFKVLLTATPLQNSLMELFGLVSVVDENVFGDGDSFRAAYANGKVKNALLHLKRRIEPVCRRTLRRQVQKAGLIKYTERSPLTITFEPADQEVALYERVSAYLQRRDTIAFGDKPNPLVVLVVRKILGSSTFAVAATLQKIIDRLQVMQRPQAEDFGDYDAVEQDIEEFGGEEDLGSVLEAAKLAAEVAELESLRDLALSIGGNSKGDKLVAVLPQALDEIAGKGGQRKAVIFTESVRTQRYLADLLAANGYADDLVLLNGQNSDSHSQTIYRGWLARHKGTDAISGSKTADMKAAIVEAFRERKSILIATESGAEGINLQFCSLLVNYDLPWNPQRVEQRIGRCHRYGQKIDVTVVNFLNLKNKAERRVFELLAEKFSLFEGVFGASDEVLGAIESGVDVERRILEIVQNGRSEAEIDAAFDALQAELKEMINEKVLEARKRLLETMDETVVKRLKMRQGEIQQHLTVFDRGLLAVAQAELPEARFHTDDARRFDYNGDTYTTEWPVADQSGWKFFRLAEGNLAVDLVSRAKGRAYAAVSHLKFNVRAHRGRLADVEQLRGKSGWLRVAKLQVTTPAVNREYLLLAALRDDGGDVHAETFERMMGVPADVLGHASVPVPEAELSAKQEEVRRLMLEKAEQQNAAWLDEESDKLDAYGEDLERGFDAEIKALETEIKEAKKALRAANLPMAEKLVEKRRISGLEGKRDGMKAAFFEKKNEIRADIEAKLDEIQKTLALEPALVPVFTIRWEVV